MLRRVDIKICSDMQHNIMCMQFVMKLHAHAIVCAWNVFMMGDVNQSAKWLSSIKGPQLVSFWLVPVVSCIMWVFSLYYSWDRYYTPSMLKEGGVCVCFSQNYVTNVASEESQNKALDRNSCVSNFWQCIWSVSIWVFLPPWFVQTINIAWLQFLRSCKF